MNPLMKPVVPIVKPKTFDELVQEAIDRNNAANPLEIKPKKSQAFDDSMMEYRNGAKK